MSNEEKLKWRLGKLPTPEEVISLLKEKIITQEEAREILFNKETANDRTTESLKDEIKFLREVVDKLALDKTRITEVIKYVHPNYSGWWTTPYIGWGTSSPVYTYTSASNGTTLNLVGSGTLYDYTVSTSGASGNGGLSCMSTMAADNFTDISTF